MITTRAHCCLVKLSLCLRGLGLGLKWRSTKKTYTLRLFNMMMAGKPTSCGAKPFNGDLLKCKQLRV
ncbi:unnamed protein product [Gadus morhua 'NCC']